MARTAAELQIDLDRLDLMLADADAIGNEWTVKMLKHARTPIAKELEPLIRPTTATRQAEVDLADAALLDYSNEANVSRDLKGAILKWKDALVRVRANMS